MTLKESAEVWYNKVVQPLVDAVKAQHIEDAVPEGGAAEEVPQQQDHEAYQIYLDGYCKGFEAGFTSGVDKGFDLGSAIVKPLAAAKKNGN